VGYAQQNPVELHAPQSFPDAPLKFANGPGYANDWLTNWTSEKATVRFELEIVQPGNYDIELGYGCAPEDAGSRIRVSIGKQSVEATVPAAVAKEVPLPHRDERSKTRYRNRQWGTLELGTLKMEKGPAQLIIKPLTMIGSQVMDLKHVKLTLRAAE